MFQAKISPCKSNPFKTLRRTHHWVFGGVDCCSSKHFIHCLGMEGSRDRETLEPVIIKYINPGTTIISDSWGPITVEKINSNGQSLNYVHFKVNYAVGFVHPLNIWVHTQMVEKMWGDLKDFIKKRCLFIKNVESHVYSYNFIYNVKNFL